MADPDHLALLKRSVEEWNAWRPEHLDIRVNLREADLKEANLREANLYRVVLNGADLREADLYKARISVSYLVEADLRGANLREANLSISTLVRANLTGAILTGANLTKTDFTDADLTDADLTDADLTDTDFTRATLTGVKQGISRSKSTTSESHPSQSSSTTDWLSLVEMYGSNLLIAAATLASIIQGLDVVERRWREHQEKHKQQGIQTSQPASASSLQPTAALSQKTPASDKEIVEILLVMDDGSQHGFKRWVSDPDALKAYIDAFSDPTSTVKPCQVVFRKLGGRALVVDVTTGGKDNKQLNVILSYLEADPL